MLRRFIFRNSPLPSIWKKIILSGASAAPWVRPPYAYLRTYRLALAKQAIASGNTLTQAAEKVGYQNAASLSRALRSAES